MRFNALTLSHDVMQKHINPGDFCIDATAGNGGDTLFLCGLTGMSGRVLAFDIQEKAVENTAAKIREAGYSDICRVIQDSHSHMAKYAAPSSASLIAFNFGWLPGGDHRLNTVSETSIEAIRQGMEILRPDGVMTLCIYYGRETGTQERDAILRYVSTLDSRVCTVFTGSFANRPNCPSIPVFIFKGI